MAEPDDPKAFLHSYLKENREALLWKLDGLSEREARLPRTTTGNNLLGLVKHCLNVEAGYFGVTFGREFPGHAELVPLTIFDDDPQADWYARADETKDGLLDLYRRVAEFADQTIATLPLDAPGQVPWWSPAGRDVTLHRIIVHVTADLARHAGHADILREQHDRAIGLTAGNDNLPDGFDWPAYVARLTTLADRC
ncbi:MAG TPA: DinB family protein [Actinoplanes sp.]|nr:DinB family protein [Actinoplanes sp.]